MKRIVGYLIVSAVVVLGGLFVTGQVTMNTFTAGEVISSEAVNENFQRLVTGLEGKQNRVEGICSEGSSVRAINADGTVECEVDNVGEAGSSGVASINGKTDAVVLEGGSNVTVDDSQSGKVIISAGGGGGGDITEVEAGSGLAGGGDSGSVTLSVDTDQVQTRVADSCAAGEAIREIKADGTVTCEAEEASAGVDFAALGSSSGLGTTLESLGSVTIMPPSDGFVVVTHKGEAVFFGDNTALQFGLGTSSAANDLYEGFVGRLDGSGTARYEHHYGSMAVVEANAGQDVTVFANAQKSSVFDANTINLTDSLLVATFFAKRY